MKNLMRFLKPYKVQAIMAPLFKMLEASFELLVPLVMAAIINKGIANGDTAYIIKMGLVLVLLGFVGLVSAVTAQYFSARTAVGFAEKLKSALFAHIQSFSFTQIDKVGASTLITRLTSDVNQVQQGVNMTLRLFLRSPFIVFGAMIMAFTINVKLALIFAVSIPVLSVIVFGIMLGTVPLYKKVQGSLDKLLVTVRENLSGVRVIRAFNMQQGEIEEFTSENDEYTKHLNFAARISALMNPLTYVIVNLALILILYLGSRQVDSGVILQGDLVAVINYMSQILVELVKLASLIILMTKAFASANRISDIFEMQAEDGEENNNSENSAPGEKIIEKAETKVDTAYPVAVEFDRVSFKYDGAGDYSLKDISFSVKRGETVGIIGGTGSGKSTLVNLIPGFYQATDGSLKIFGTEAKDIDSVRLKDIVGICMQKPYAIKGTIRDNVKFGSVDATDEEVKEALELAQAAEFVNSRKKGLDEEVSQNGTSLSGGQRQRLMIARALIKKPEILILDDSSSALDYATDKKLRAAIKTLQNTTTFIVSQRTATVLHADKIIVMDDGMIAGIGTHDELLKNNEVYREIYESQIQQQ